MEKDASVVKENIETLFSNLERFLKTETVIGEPIVVGETTLVPIITVTFGCGTGGGTGKEGKTGNEGVGSGGGAGARISPNAILVIRKDEVTMLPVKGQNNLENLLKMVPEIVSKVKSNKDENVEKEEQDEKND